MDKVSPNYLRLQQLRCLSMTPFAMQLKSGTSRSYRSGPLQSGLFVSNALSFTISQASTIGFSIWGADSPNGRPSALELLTVEEAKKAIDTGSCFSRNTKQIRTHGVQPVIFNEQTR